MDIFAGSSFSSCQTDNCTIEGTEISALKSRFRKCVFIVNNSEEAALLEESTIKYKSRSHIISGNCISDSILQEAFDLIPRSESSLVLVDPAGYTKLRWTTVKKLASHGTDWKGHKADMLIFFPLEMALLRNLTRTDCETSIDRLYGNTCWRDIRKDRLDNKIDHNQAGSELIKLLKKGLNAIQVRR